MSYTIGSDNEYIENGSDYSVNTDCLMQMNDAYIQEFEAEIKRLQNIIQQQVDLKLKVDELQNEIKKLREFPALPPIPQNSKDYPFSFQIDSQWWQKICQFPNSEKSKSTDITLPKSLGGITLRGLLSIERRGKPLKLHFYLSKCIEDENPRLPIIFKLIKLVYNFNTSLAKPGELIGDIKNRQIIFINRKENHKKLVCNFNIEHLLQMQIINVKVDILLGTNFIIV